MRYVFALTASLILSASAGWAQLRQLKPGWNLFSAQQDVQLGREASQQLETRLAMVHNREMDAYLNSILKKLERSDYARSLGRDGSRSEMFPFTIQAVYDKKVNAFSLPGGPIYVNTGLLEMTDNEAQLAGIISHEMSHIVLRHSTNQASKQNLVALPALLAGALVGHSLLGQLTQIGIGVGANSILLKFSRADEAEADYNGAQLMADARYNPLELANFFEKLEAKSGHAGSMVQFLSDHPNPGNRVAAVSEEIQYFPHRQYVEDETGQFKRIREVVRHLAGPGAGPHIALAPDSRPAGGMLPYRGQSFTLSYPQNWEIFGEPHSNTVTFASQEGLVEGDKGTSVGYGLEVSYFAPIGGSVNLDRDTQALIRHLRQANKEMRIGRDARSIQVGDVPALLTTLYSSSPYGGKREVDALVTVSRPEGLFYMVFIAPQSEFDQIQTTFEDIVRSVRFF
jgi:beta-barrel assembly-enhancing protease